MAKVATSKAAKAAAGSTAVVALALGLVACGSGGSQAASSSSATSAPRALATTTRAVPTSTTVPVTQAGGSRTVLSPIGVHVRARPSLSGRVIASAAQGVVLSVLGHTNAGGGWFKVRGTTVTGWMSDDPALSAAGHFSSYSSASFGLLYPASWTVHRAKSSVVFRSPVPGGAYVIVSTAPSLAKLPQLRPGVNGASETAARQVVACGVTSYLDTFTTPSHKVLQLLLPLDATHALGLQGYLTKPSQVPVFLDFVNSVWFPFPQCIGPAPTPQKPTTTAHTQKPTTTHKA